MATARSNLILPTIQLCLYNNSFILELIYFDHIVDVNVTTFMHISTLLVSDNISLLATTCLTC